MRFPCRGGALFAALLAVSLVLARPPRLPAQEIRADAARLMNELMAGKVPVGGPFTLTDPDGKRRSLAEFRGQVVLLYFGYTFCPDVCPTDLSAIAAALRSLGAESAQVQPIFVTVDPARDTAAVLRGYAAALHPRLLALRGSATEVRAVATAYKTYYEKVPRPDGQPYLVDHTGFVYVLGRRGEYLAFLPPGTSAERMAVMLRQAIEETREGR